MSWFRSRASKPTDLYCRALCIAFRFPVSRVPTFTCRKVPVVGTGNCPRLSRYTRSRGRLRRNLSAGEYFDNPKYSEGVLWILRRMARIQLAELTAFVAVAEH